MLRRRRAVAVVTGTALALGVAYVGVGAVRPARSAPPAERLAAHPQREQPPAARTLSVPAVGRKRPAPYRIAFFGDSVSVGYGAVDHEHGYVARVTAWLRKRGKRVVATVYAKGGVPVAYWQHAPIPRRLDAAVIELGTNDVRLGTSPARFSQEYRTLTRRIRTANRRTQVLCLSVWSHPGGESLDSVVNAQIRAVCPGGYVDITRLRNRRWIRSSDRFHPNNAGYRLIARAVRSRLKTR